MHNCSKKQLARPLRKRSGLFLFFIPMSQLASSLQTITENLMRIRTTSDRPDELVRAVDYVVSLLPPDAGLVVERFLSGEKPSVVISTQATRTPDVLMMGHLDVVPAPDALFEPRIEQGVLYGRGACDMKSEIAVMLDLMIKVVKQEPRQNIALMLTCDEEIGGEHGVGYLVNEIGYRPKVALVPDGGEAPHDLILANKGALHIRMTAIGIAAHASRPWLGKNANAELIAAYQRIEKLFPASDDPARWYVTCSLNVMAGGSATNLIPSAAEAKIDIRFPETENAAELLTRIQEAAAPVAVESLTSSPASLTSANDVHVQRFAEVVAKTTGEHVCFGKSHGANDGRYLTQYGIPIIVSRPISGGQHSDGEWVDLSSLLTFHEVYRAYLGLSTE
jgi:succinyl-diaminopimelate desuccinylase